MNTKRVWYSPKTDIKSPDAIHQILMFGRLTDIQSLKKKVGEAKLKEIFLRFPKKIYTNPALNFIKNFILKIKTSIDEQKYLKTAQRIVR